MKLFSALTHIRGHAVWTRGLGPGTVVVDAGAHKGEFSRTMTQDYGCTCYLVEANPLLAEKMRENGVENVINAALGGDDGFARFITRENPEGGGIIANLTDTGEASVEVETVSLPTLVERLSLPKIDLLKLDIEGAEFDLFRKIPGKFLEGIGQITVEFHDFLPTFKNQGLYEIARDRLVGLGFICCPMAFRTHGDVLFLNQKNLKIGTVPAWAYSHLARWWLRLSADPSEWVKSRRW